MKYAAQIAYNGANYYGWQRQNNHSEREIGVQQVIEEALSNLNNNQPVKVTGAGRTDQGVHARGQVASFELDKIFEPEKLLLAVNFYLPEDIRVMKIFKINNPNFDARRSALWREYKYFIYHGRVCPPHLNGFVWWNKHDWDKKIARAACKILIGRHDFKAFCKARECPENTIRDITKLKFQAFNNLSVLTVQAPSFMTNMVRIIAGNINEAATKKRGLDWLEDLLLNKARASSAMTAPAQGLCFWRAGYKEFKI